MITVRNIIRVSFVLLSFLLLQTGRAAAQSVLKASDYHHYIDSFNANDDELYRQAFTDKGAWQFLQANIPLFDCPDQQLEETYYFRWWTLRKHIKQTPAGYIFSEFLPAVNWAGKYNSINCAAGHHFYEARWLHNPAFLDDYMHFWVDSSNGGIHRYSFWAADAWKAFLSVHPEKQDTGMLLKLVENYQYWQSTNQDSIHELYWQVDGLDGMEVSVGAQLDNGGVPAHAYKAIRPTLNSYMYGDAKAIAVLAKQYHQHNLSQTFDAKADAIKQTMQQVLWNDSLQFFGSYSLAKNTSKPSLLPVRELIGLVPWYFNLPDDQTGFGSAWKQLVDTGGFMAPFGPTTCERRHRFFSISYQDHECQWNGPSWPFATSQTLTAMANLLDNYTQHTIQKKDYYRLLSIYANSHRRVNEQGKTVPWIDENLNPFTGDWISRTRLAEWPGNPWPKDKGGKERGKDYNHSSFNDLVITGLIGLRPSLDNSLAIHPLTPDNWEYYCLDNVLYHGRILTIFFDKTGRHYNRGKGWFVLADGKQVYHSDTIKKTTIQL